MLSIIRTAIEKSGLILKKCPLHGDHYSAKETSEMTSRGYKKSRAFIGATLLYEDRWAKAHPTSLMRLT